jgi:hypothetical protein
LTSRLGDVLRAAGPDAKRRQPDHAVDGVPGVEPLGRPVDPPVRRAVVDVMVAGDDVQPALVREPQDLVVCDRRGPDLADALKVKERARVRAEHPHQGVVGHELKQRVGAVLVPPRGHDEAEPVPDGSLPTEWRQVGRPAHG